MKAPTWTPALAAAVIDVELSETKPVDTFSRAHVTALRNAGCTRAQVRDYLVSIFGRQRVRRGGAMVSAVDHVLSDLDSYGDWPG